MDYSGDIISKLSRRGYRLTPQRMMILEAVEAANDHISADEIYSRVCDRYPHLNISTVYRTLELLKELGLVTETDMGDGRVRYHSIKKGHHHHLVCQNCGCVTDLNEAVLLPLKDTLYKTYNFKADLAHLAIFGRCSSCR
ncbi:MAG: transcriptional repressor [Dehalococcoidia bacterium]|nr:MAG: transcriptional repressor [Dehalococcoidia bacterium]